MELPTHRVCTLSSVEVYPEKDGFQNVIRKVIWDIKSQPVEGREDLEVKARIESFLDISNLDSNTFRDINSMSKADIIKLSIEAEGGLDYINHINSIFDQEEAKRIASAELTKFDFSTLED